MEFNLLSALKSINVNGDEAEARDAVRFEHEWHNTTAVATNTAIAERTVVRAKRKCRIVGILLVLDAAVTGTATDFFTLLIDKRTAGTPGTPVNLVTFAADTATTDNCVAFADKDLLAAATFATYVPTAVAADFDLAAGDKVTAEVTKSTATGMTFPTGKLFIILEPRT